MDLDAIRIEVFKQTGMRIDKGDPFYAALVMLSAIGKEIGHNNDASLTRIAEIANTASVSGERHHAQNEQVLGEAVAKIQKAVAQVTGVQNGISEAAAKQALGVLSPIVLSTNEVLKTLQDKKDAVTAALSNVQKTQAQWAENIGFAIGSAALALLITSGCAFYVGHVSAQKEIQRRAEWLDSEDGKYALQLKDVGSLKALATCSAGPFKNDWQKSKDGLVCFPNPTNGSVVGWRISP